MPLDASLFVSDQLHERRVKLGDGSEHTMHFRELPAVAFRSFQIAEASEDEEIRAGSMARLIVASLREPTGEPALTYEKAKTLKPHVQSAIVREILSLNRVDADAEKKASPPEVTAGSGTS